MTKQRLLTPAVLILLAFLAGSLVAQEHPGILTLRQAVDRALDKHPGLTAQRLEESLRHQDYRQARSFFLPHLSLEGGAETSDEPGFVFSRSIQQGFLDPKYLVHPDLLAHPDTIQNFRFRVSGQQLVYDGGRVRGAMSAAKAGEEIARQQTRAEADRLSLQVAEVYLRLIQLASQERVLEKTGQALEAARGRAADLVEQGLAVQSDELQVRVRQAEVERQRIALNQARELSRYQLAQLMGDENQGDAVRVPETIPHFQELSLDPLEACQQQAQSRNPQLALLQAAGQAAAGDVQRQKGNYLPQVGLWAGYETNSDGDTHHADGYAAGLTLRWDIYDGSAREAALGAARVRQEQVEARRQEARDAIALGTRKAYLDMETARQQLRVARESAGLAAESFRIIKDRYENGLTTVDDLLGAEAALRQAESAQVEAMVQYTLHRLQLAAVTGDIQSVIDLIQQEYLS